MRGPVPFILLLPLAFVSACEMMDKMDKSLKKMDEMKNLTAQKMDEMKRVTLEGMGHSNKYSDKLVKQGEGLQEGLKQQEQAIREQLLREQWKVVSDPAQPPLARIRSARVMVLTTDGMPLGLQNILLHLEVEMNPFPPRLINDTVWDNKHGLRINQIFVLGMEFKDYERLVNDAIKPDPSGMFARLALQFIAFSLEKIHMAYPTGLGDTLIQRALSRAEFQKLVESLIFSHKLVKLVAGLQDLPFPADEKDPYFKIMAQWEDRMIRFATALRDQIVPKFSEYQAEGYQRLLQALEREFWGKP